MLLDVIKKILYGEPSNHEQSSKKSSTSSISEAFTKAIDETEEAKELAKKTNVPILVVEQKPKIVNPVRDETIRKEIKKEYICPDAGNCTMEFECSHRKPHEWNDHCTNRLNIGHSNGSTEEVVENENCPYYGCVECKREVEVKVHQIERKVPRYPEKSTISNVIYYNPAIHTNQVNSKCNNCGLEPIVNEKKDDIDVKKILQDVVRKIDEMSDEKINLSDEKCNPHTCWGECNGKGECYVAKEWQDRIHHQVYGHYGYNDGFYGGGSYGYFQWNTKPKNKHHIKSKSKKQRKKERKLRRLEIQNRRKKRR